MFKNKLILKYPETVVDTPVISNAIKKFDITVNLLKVEINPNTNGIVIMEMQAEKDDYKKALDYFEQFNITVKPLSKDITRHEKKCTHCSVCVAHCPTKALYVKDRKTMEIGFDPEKCVACENCIAVCSYKAMTLKI